MDSINIDKIDNKLQQTSFNLIITNNKSIESNSEINVDYTNNINKCYHYDDYDDVIAGNKLLDIDIDHIQRVLSNMDYVIKKNEKIQFFLNKIYFKKGNNFLKDNIIVWYYLGIKREVYIVEYEIKEDFNVLHGVINILISVNEENQISFYIDFSFIRCTTSSNTLLTFKIFNLKVFKEDTKFSLESEISFGEHFWVAFGSFSKIFIDNTYNQIESVILNVSSIQKIIHYFENLTELKKICNSLCDDVIEIDKNTYEMKFSDQKSVFLRKINADNILYSDDNDFEFDFFSYKVCYEIDYHYTKTTDICPYQNIIFKLNDFEDRILLEFIHVYKYKPDNPSFYIFANLKKTILLQLKDYFEKSN